MLLRQQSGIDSVSLQLLQTRDMGLQGSNLRELSGTGRGGAAPRNSVPGGGTEVLGEVVLASVLQALASIECFDKLGCTV